MSTTTVTWGKWTELGKELEKVVRENNDKPKGQKKTLLQIFEDFENNHDTTANSASRYYYDTIKPKLELESKSYDDEMEEFIKNTQVDPIYRNVRDAHKVGDTVNGEVINLTNFGAFVRTDKGFEGLIHISQITGKEYVTLPEDYFYVGEKVKAKVVRYEGEKLNLSTRAVGGKEKINPAFKDLAKAREEVKVEKPRVEPPKVLAPTFEPKVEPKIEPKVEKVPEPVISVTNNDRDNIINFIKKYSDNNVSQKALGDIQDLITEFGVFQTTISLMETVRDLDISSFITEMTKERLEGEYLRH